MTKLIVETSVSECGSKPVLAAPSITDIRMLETQVGRHYYDPIEVQIKGG